MCYFVSTQVHPHRSLPHFGGGASTPGFFNEAGEGLGGEMGDGGEPAISSYRALRISLGGLGGSNTVTSASTRRL